MARSTKSWVVASLLVGATCLVIFTLLVRRYDFPVEIADTHYLVSFNDAEVASMTDGLNYSIKITPEITVECDVLDKALGRDKEENERVVEVTVQVVRRMTIAESLRSADLTLPIPRLEFFDRLEDGLDARLNVPGALIQKELQWNADVSDTDLGGGQNPLAAPKGEMPTSGLVRIRSEAAQINTSCPIKLHPVLTL